MTPIVELMLKATAVLALAAAAAVLARGASAAARHAVWFGAFAALLALPFATRLAPQWSVPVAVLSPPAAPSLPRVLAEADPPAPVAIRAARSRPVVAPREIQRTPTTTTRWRAAALLAIWLVGVFACALRLVAGQVAVRRIARGGRPPLDPRWSVLLDDERRRAGVGRAVRLLAADGIGTPATWGIARPVIVLPETAAAWPEAQRRIALCHELAHVARLDALTQVVANVCCALYWFHPGVWLAARRLCAEREQACDDRVLASGCTAPDYALQLVAMARSAGRSRLPALIGVPMARPSGFESRLVALLDARRARGRPSAARAALGVATAGALVATLAAFHPVATALDPVGAPRPVVALTATAPAPAPTPAPVTATPLPAEQPADPASVVERTYRATPGETLTFDLRTGGDIDVHGTDARTVTIRAELAGAGWRDTRLVVGPVDGGIRVETSYAPGTRLQQSSHRFVVEVPRRYDVRIASAGGTVTIRDLDGTVSGSTGGGSIHVSAASGRLALTTGGGGVHVSDSRLTGYVGTGGGAVRIERVEGDLRGSSGTGDVTYGRDRVIDLGGDARDDRRERADRADRADRAAELAQRRTELDERVNPPAERQRDGVVRITRMGGAITVSEAPDGAVLSTAGGGIRLARGTGAVRATTGGGDVHIGRLDGSAYVTTGAGNVSITIDGAGDGDHDVTVYSGNGTIDLYLPADLSARLDLESAYTDNFGGGPTRITSDWRIPITTTDRWDDGMGTPRKYVRSRATLGGGRNLIRVRTVNGDVRLHTLESGGTWSSRTRIFE